MGIRAMSMPTSAEGTDCSAQAISENGMILPVRLNNVSLGHHSRPRHHRCWRHRHTHQTTSAPIQRRHHTMKSGWNDSSATAINAKAKPHTNTRYASSAQCLKVLCAISPKRVRRRATAIVPLK